MRYFLFLTLFFNAFAQDVMIRRAVTSNVFVVPPLTATGDQNKVTFSWTDVSSTSYDSVHVFTGSTSSSLNWTASVPRGRGYYVDSNYQYNTLRFAKIRVKYNDGRTSDFGSVVNDTVNMWLGSELVTNGGFDADANWSKINATISDGKANIVSVASALSQVWQIVACTSGYTYRCTFDIERTSGTLIAYYYTEGNITLSSTIASTGSYSFTITATTTGSALAFKRANSCTITVDNVSMKQIKNYPDITPPSLPTNLAWTALTKDTLLLYWTNPPESDFNRNVLYFNGAVKDSSSNDSIRVGGLSANTTYTWKVLSVDNTGNRSSYTSSVSSTTLDEPSMIVYMPADLMTSASGDSLGSLEELQDLIDNGDIKPGASIRFERGGVWTDRCGKYLSNHRGYVGLDLSQLRGTANQWIVIENYGSGDLPKFDFIGEGDIFVINGTQYVTIDGLEFHSTGTYTHRNLPRYTVYGYSGTDTIKYIEFSNNVVDNIGGGFYINTGAVVHNLTFSNNIFRNTFSTTGIYGTGSGCGINVRRYSGSGYLDSVTIENNTFQDNGSVNDSTGHEHGMYFGASTLNFIIRNNVFKNVVRGVNRGDGIALAGGKRIWISDNTFEHMRIGMTITPQQANYGRLDSVYVYNNQLTDIGYAGIQIAGLDDYHFNWVNEVKLYNNVMHNFTGGNGITILKVDTLTNCLIANNTLVNIGSGAPFYHAYSRPNFANNNRLLNNIFVNTTTTSPLVYFFGRDLIEDDTAWTSINYNLYYRTVGTAYVNIDGDIYTSVSAFSSATGHEANGSQSNPLFESLEGRNFKLTVSSPKNNGFDLYSEGITTDFEGDLRLFTTFDIGADEYVP